MNCGSGIFPGLAACLGWCSSRGLRLRGRIGLSNALELFGIGAILGAGMRVWRCPTTGFVTRSAGKMEYFGGAMVRFHVGLEDPVDLVADLEKAMGGALRNAAGCVELGLLSKPKEMRMRSLPLFLLAGFAILPRAAMCAAPSVGSAHADILAKSTASWNGKPYTAYPAGQPQLTVLKMTIPPHTALPWHTHPFPNAGYVLSGQLTIEDKASGKNQTFHAGEAFYRVGR